MKKTNEYPSKENVYAQVWVVPFRDEELLATLGAELTHTLIAISMFLPDAYPTQKLLAKVMGISLTSANARIQKLAAFRWHGQPIIKVTKTRNKGGLFANNKYEILSNAGITMYEKSHSTNTSSTNANNPDTDVIEHKNSKSKEDY